MPKLRIDPARKAKDDFLQEIRVKRATYNIKQREVADELGVAPSTMSVLLSRPDEISIGRLRKIIAFLRLNPLVVLAFLGIHPKELRAALRDDEISGECI